MDMNAMKGTQSIAFSESPYLVSAGSVAGKKEGEGPLGKYFDIASEDDLFGEKTWELAEGTMQKLACKLALKNAGVQPEEVRYLFGPNSSLRAVVSRSKSRYFFNVFPMDTPKY